DEESCQQAGDHEESAARLATFIGNDVLYQPVEFIQIGKRLMLDRQLPVNLFYMDHFFFTFFAHKSKKLEFHGVCVVDSEQVSSVQARVAEWQTR
ncbi:MAG: hypothetical protein ABR497_11310, partial [Kiritimatiellia bacterium]